MDSAFVVPEPVVAFILGGVAVRAVWVTITRAVADADRRRKQIARQRKARTVRRLERKAWRWFAAVDVLSLVRPKGPTAGYAQTRANDLFDRERATRRQRWDGWAPRVVLPAAPPKRSRRRR